MVQRALIGTDPEAFVAEGPNIVHCIDMLGGSKQAPLLVLDGGIQEDNVLFECNVDPSDDPDVFLQRLRTVLSQGRDILLQHGLRLVPGVSSHIYNPEVLATFPPKAFEFGCTPDYNFMTGEENPSPSATNECLRTAGGHVHIGFDHLVEVTRDVQIRVGQMCDYVLGLPSLLEDTDDRRRELYGRAGAGRFKPYGIEYRTLSNYWVWDDELVCLIHKRAQNAFSKHERLEELKAIIPLEDVQNAINTNNRVEAKAMLKLLVNLGV